MTSIGEILGFGARRLKIVLALRRYPELDDPEWSGDLTFRLGRGGSVKTTGPVGAAREVEIDEPLPNGLRAA